MSRIETITGTISYVGGAQVGSLVHVYDSIEVDTASGRVDLVMVMVQNSMERVIQPGCKVTMKVLRGTSKKLGAVVLGIFDHAARRAFTMDDATALRARAMTQAVLFSIVAVVAIPIGFALFIVPGIAGCFILWKQWSTGLALPHAFEVQRELDSLTALAADAVKYGAPAPAQASLSAAAEVHASRELDTAETQ